jgi:uncharacterized protein (DUF3084 family)
MDSVNKAIKESERMGKNAWTRSVGMFEKNKALAKAQVKAYSVKSRNKKFGEEYMELVKNKASEEELQACIKAAEADVGEIEKEIEDLKKQAADIDQVTSKSIVNPDEMNESMNSVDLNKASDPTI